MRRLDFATLHRGATEGTFRRYELPSLLVRVARQGRTGRLTLADGNKERTVGFSGGLPTLAGSQTQSEHLGQRLLKLHLVTPEQLAQVDALMCREPVQFGEAMLRLGFMREDELRRTLRTHHNWVISQCLAASEVRSTFAPYVWVAKDPSGLALLQALEDGVRTYGGAAHEELLEHAAGWRFEVVREDVELARRLNCSKTVASALERLQGAPRTSRQIAGACEDGTPEVMGAMLILSGLMRATPVATVAVPATRERAAVAPVGIPAPAGGAVAAGAARAAPAGGAVAAGTGRAAAASSEEAAAAAGPAGPAGSVPSAEVAASGGDEGSSPAPGLTLSGPGSLPPVTLLAGTSSALPLPARFVGWLERVSATPLARRLGLDPVGLEYVLAAALFAIGLAVGLLLWPEPFDVNANLEPPEPPLLAAPPPGVPRLEPFAETAALEAGGKKAASSAAKPSPARAAAPRPAAPPAAAPDPLAAELAACGRLAQAGDYRNAIAACQRVLAGNPRHAGAYRYLGICYSKLGIRVQACEAYRRYLRFAGQPPDRAQVEAVLARCD